MLIKMVGPEKNRFLADFGVKIGILGQKTVKKMAKIGPKSSKTQITFSKNPKIKNLSEPS